MQNELNKNIYCSDDNRKVASFMSPKPSEFNLRNQIIRDADYEYQYDLNGNIIAKYMRNSCESSSRGMNEIAMPCPSPVLRFAYYYDADNKMSTIQHFYGSGDDEMILSFRYDPLGRRIFKSERDGTDGYLYKDSWYAYDGDDVIADYTVPPYSDPNATPEPR